MGGSVVKTISKYLQVKLQITSFPLNFSFLGLISDFVKTISNQHLLYRAFPSFITSIISNPTLKDCCLTCYLLSLFIQIPIVRMGPPSVPSEQCQCFEFCAIFLSDRSKLRHEITIPPFKGAFVSTVQSVLQIILFVKEDCCVLCGQST